MKRESIFFALMTFIIITDFILSWFLHSFVKYRFTI